MKKLKANIQLACKKAYEKFNETVLSNDEKRTIIGGAMSVGSFVWMLIASDTCTVNEVGFLTTLLSGMLFILGLTIITKDFNKAQNIVTRATGELMAFFLAVLAVYVIAEDITATLVKINVWERILLLLSLIYAVWYLFRIAAFLFRKIKKIVIYITDKISTVDYEGKTKSLDAVLKNLVSIAGTLAVIYKFLEPLIDKIFGLL